MKYEELSGYQDAIKKTKFYNGRAKVELRKLDKFISNCKDSLVRKIIIERYLKGYSWTATANRIGGGITADNCRMLVVRYINGRRKR